MTYWFSIHLSKRLWELRRTPVLSVIDHHSKTITKVSFSIAIMYRSRCNYLSFIIIIPTFTTIMTVIITIIAAFINLLVFCASLLLPSQNHKHHHHRHHLG